MSDNSNEKIAYAFKRFFLYLLFAIPATLFPFTFFGLMFGFIPILITSFFLSICDGVQFVPNGNTEVFTKKIGIVFLVEIIFIGICLFLYAHLRK